MSYDTSNIDIRRLREDMKDECMGAFFGGGIGPAILDYGDIEDANPQKLIEIAQRYGYNLNKYKR